MSASLLHTASTVNTFQQLFDVQLADTETLRRRVSQVRYQVFCEELGFAMTHRDGHEQDDYDASSLHCLIHHRPSAADIGCIRLVLPGPRGGGLPFEKFGVQHIDRKLLDWRKLDPTRCCEISRLAVVSAFRRPALVPSLRSATDLNQPHTLKRLPAVAQALYQSVIALILAREFESMFMVGEPRLQRHLASCGIPMRQISPTFEYFGPRAVFVIDNSSLKQAVSEWENERLDLYQLVYQQMNGAQPLVADDDRQSVVA